MALLRRVNLITAQGQLVVVALVFFIKRKGKLAEPLINLRPLGNPAFAVGVVVNMLSLITIFALVGFFLALWVRRNAAQPIAQVATPAASTVEGVLEDQTPYGEPA